MTEREISLPMSAAAIPHFESWLGDWAMCEYAVSAVMQAVSATDLPRHLAAVGKGFGRQSDLEIVDGVAVVQLRGVLLKSAPSLLAGTSTVEVRRQIRQAAANPDVASILLMCDSPGGTVAGTAALADDVAAAAKRKPVIAFVEDVCASAAYWICSQATTIVANNSALLGSIGTYATVRDDSAAQAARGIRVHVVKAGRYKAIGEGEVSQDDLSEVQRRVNALNTLFLVTVARGRRLSMARLETLSEARVYVAAEANRMGLGLADRIGSDDEAWALAHAAVKTLRDSPAYRAVLAAEQELSAVQNSSYGISERSRSMHTTRMHHAQSALSAARDAYTKFRREAFAAT
jgi:signal peptide peptidase SppA